MKCSDNLNYIQRGGDVVEVIVRYPAWTYSPGDFRGGTYFARTEEKSVVMYYHGRTHKNPSRCIVESQDGAIHVVNESIVHKVVSI